MFTFVDLMSKAQGGKAFENIAKAYGLKRGDLEALTVALLPMFQIGLQRTIAEMSSPATMADLFDPEKFGAAFEDAHAAVSPAATEAGRMALERMFGSRDAARVVADQAAAITGVGSDVVSKVMPTLAATLLGGIGKAIADTPMESVMKAWSGGVDPAAEPLEAMVAPYRDAMSAFMKGYAEGKPQAEQEASSAWQGGMDAFAKMFEAGVEISEQNRRAFEKILDSPRRPSRRKPD